MVSQNLHFFIIIFFQKYFGKSKMDIYKCPKSIYEKQSWIFEKYDKYIINSQINLKNLFFILFKKIN